MTPAEKLRVLRSVELLSVLDEAALVELASQAEVRTYRPGKRVVSELEFGADVYVLAEGQAEVSVFPHVGPRRVLGELGPGALFGEMASLTGELRSATVIATTELRVLSFADSVFDRLRICYPEIALSLVRTMAARLTEAERTLSSLLSTESETNTRAETQRTRSTVGVLWRELVVSRHKDLAFLTLLSFVLTLLLVRALVYLAFINDFAPFEVLRAAYVSGFALVIAGACAALLTFRPKSRRVIAGLFGVGIALIVNELGVTLAFDIFYKDITTRDPTLVFDVERLYRRTEPVRAIVVMLTLLLQAVYLKVFYQRLWHLVRMRLLQAFKGRSRKAA